jgi:hypothetical protein
LCLACRCRGAGTETGLRHTLEVRELLQAVVRGEQPAGALAPVLRGAVYVPAIAVYIPEIREGRITWALSVPPERELALQAVLTWDALAEKGQARDGCLAGRERRVSALTGASPTRRRAVPS